MSRISEVDCMLSSIQARSGRDRSILRCLALDAGNTSIHGAARCAGHCWLQERPGLGRLILLHLEILNRLMPSQAGTPHASPLCVGVRHAPAMLMFIRFVTSHCALLISLFGSLLEAFLVVSCTYNVHCLFTSETAFFSLVGINHILKFKPPNIAVDLKIAFSISLTTYP